MPYKKGKSGNPRGRPKGVKNKPNRKILKMEEILAAHGYNPQEELIKISAYAKKQAARQKDPNDKARFLEIAARNARELVQYVAPKRRAVEHTGYVDTEPRVHQNFEGLPAELREQLRHYLVTRVEQPETAMVDITPPRSLPAPVEAKP